jgi:membrane fusion protein, multidrug efflux system
MYIQMKTVKFSLLAMLFAVIAISCGGGESAEKSKDPAKVRAAIKAKQEAIKKLTAEKEALEKWLVQIDSTAKKMKVVEITAQQLTIKDFSHYIEVQGNITTSDDPGTASSETGGRIVKLYAKKDAYVKQGDLIAKVDLESIRKSIQEIEISLNLAKDIFDRQEKLWKQNIGSEVQYLQSKNQVDQLQKTKERLEHELEKANVYAPVNGHIEQVMAKEGEMCGPGTPIVQIVNSSTLKIVAQVPENFLGKVKVGDAVEIDFPALETKQNSRVKKIGRMINSVNRTFEVEASVDSKGGQIKPNLLATMLIQDYGKAKAISLPDDLIMQDVDGNSYVMLVKDNKAAKRTVTLGKSYKNETVIETGLDGNETLIIKGARQVVDGDEVKVLSEDK